MKGHRHHGHHHSDQLERMTTLRRFGPGPEGPGFGFGPGSGPRHGFGGPPFGGGRGRRRRGDVRFALLRALEDDPQNGYQLMQGIEERTGGRWRPSPGSVYPALAQLEDQGFLRSVERDGHNVYELTDAGRELAGPLRLLAGWGARYGGVEASGETPRHGACGTPLEARWWCPACEQPVDEDDTEELHFA